MKDVDDLQNFFLQLVKDFLDANSPGARLDFLSCPLTQSSDALEIVQFLEDLVNVSTHHYCTRMVCLCFYNCDPKKT